MNFWKLREVIVHNMPRKKNLLHFLHRCHGLREMSKIQSPQENRMRVWLAKALKRRKRPDPLKILAKASLTKHGTWLGTPSPNFKKFGENFVNCEFFVPNTGFGHLTGLTLRVTIHGGNSKQGKLCIFGIFMQKYTCLWMGFRFYGDLGFQKLKIHANFDFLPLFWVAESFLGRNNFLGVTSSPNSKIPLGLESRLADLSNKLSCTWCGHQEGPQTELWMCATSQSDVRDLSGKFACFDQFGQQNTVFTLVDFWGM